MNKCVHHKRYIRRIHSSSPVLVDENITILLSPFQDNQKIEYLGLYNGLTFAKYFIKLFS